MWLKSKAVQIWARRLHIYISMALLVVTLFFALTGVTLNHPDWFELREPVRQQHTFTISTDLLLGADHQVKIDKSRLLVLMNSQFELRGTPSEMDIYTEVENGQLLMGEISLDFKGPGYNATAFVDLLSGKTEVETTDYGWVALLNDLHKGRNSGGVWKWFIDISAMLMVLFVLSGVCLLLPKRKTLITSIQWTGLGTLLTLIIYLFAVP
ncbi:PepSY-associated TM helix domain-containing protein [Vibrio sagamiensis]|uniref:Peptidase n=1 Tax=Vibrio sagamiensis NBRC 104589 TaxID=1219064 RepID=A0A511QFN2_9VIBR|nr:PepSY-associated TM helix domain-containing protein [Vibrio sagamiensis]PNQ68855.1 peptidase [Vibrio agarivorans]GEM75262.1 peptidase [Vibrio sagamiensis NBRC 104589]